MQRLKHMETCQLCGTAFQFGPDLYAGKQIARYALTVCKGCYRSNWDGWAPALEPAFVQHLEAKGIPLPDRNEKGWYPRD